ncbi:MAG: fimbria/pilus periplasmic chaperone [Gammaproteobacteria bacterium]
MRPQPLAKFAAASAGRFGLTLLSLWGTAAYALTISPVLVELSPGRRIVSITIANPGDRAVTFQTQTLAWDQPDGVDRYVETDDLIVVPPIATIGAGGTQILRVTTRAPASAQEQAYRLVLEDVTELTAPSSPSSEGTAINIRINHNLPVFVSAPGKPRPQPRLGRCTSPTPQPSAGTGCIRLDNDGTRYLAVKSMTVDGANLHLELKGGPRVLAGAWHQWTFDLPPKFVGTLQAKAETSAGPVNFEWPIPAR